ncbi:MAG: NAD(P)-dependent oxidoreductase [bacterium]|nr:NAD(P)-dependent oxidoreductase [bacterium]
MKVLITGSNGLLGQKLIDLMAPMQDVTLIATSNGNNRYPVGKNEFDYYPMDITSPVEIKSVFSRTNPDFVINTAAMTNVDQCESEKENCWKLNVEAVSHLVEACRESNSFFLHLSTDFIFDGENGPYSEEDIAKPVSYYGESKLAAENLITESDISWAIARTVLVYGIAHDMSRSNIILWVKNSLENKKEIKVVNDQWRTPTLAEDLAMGCYLILKKRATGIYNISGKDFLNPYEMAVKTANFFKLDMSTMTEVDGSIFSQPAKRPPKTGFILDKANRELGYNPRSFDEGIAILAKQLEEGL